MKKHMKVASGLVALGLFMTVTPAFAALEMYGGTSPNNQTALKNQPTDTLKSTDEFRTVGRIEIIDPQNGYLTLRENNPSGNSDHLSQYWISQRRTTVTDPMDKQFLKLDDLKAGQIVRVDYTKSPDKPDRWDARKIVLFPTKDVRWVFGKVESIDPSTNTVVLYEIVPDRTLNEPIYFVVDPIQTSLIYPSQREFITLKSLRPGDRVQVLIPSKAGGGWPIRSLWNLRQCQS